MTISFPSVAFYAGKARDELAAGYRGSAQYCATLAGAREWDLAQTQGREPANPFAESEAQLRQWAEEGMRSFAAAGLSAPAGGRAVRWRGTTHAAHTHRED